MTEALLRELFVDDHADAVDVDEFFEQFSERELVKEAIVNCVYARQFPQSRADRLDSVLAHRFADDDRVDDELLHEVCVDLEISPAAIDSFPW